MQQNNNQTLWQVIKSYFNVLPDKGSEKEVVKQITDGINFQGANLWVLIFAIFIGSDYWRNAYLPTHGTYHWHGISDRNS